MAATYGHTKAMPWESILRLPRARREEREVRELAEQVLSFFGQRLAGYRWDQPAYSLSYANRRRLEIARALATRPKVLLLDEPAAGMNPKETGEVTELIGRLRDELGIAILVIEHDMHVVANCSDRVSRSTTASRSPRGASTRSQIIRRSSRRTSGAIPRRWRRHERERLRCCTSRTSPRTTRRCGSSRGSRCGRRRRARLPARRQRQRQVDDAQDDPRHRPAALGAGAARRRRRQPLAGARGGSRTGSRSSPRTVACSAT